tara:strand:+ start:880 stop:1401 length:522 start_codon:yes stop_codon:yes gene_type:complete
LERKKIPFSFICMAALIAAAAAALFVPSGPTTAAARASQVRMGFFDFIAGSADSVCTSVPPGMVTAHHILLRAEDHGGSTEAAEAEASKLMERLEANEFSFEEAATQYSSCPSRAQQGDLGTFSKLGQVCWLPYEGEDVGEFDRLVVSEETRLGEVYQVTTKFGAHLVRVDAR